MQLQFHQKAGPEPADMAPLVSPAAGEGWLHGGGGMTAAPFRKFSDNIYIYIYIYTNIHDRDGERT